MKRLIAFLLFVFILNIENNFSQCGALGIELKSQKDVDEFPINYPGCHRILGDLLIENTDITNLDSLYVIDTIDYYMSLTNNFQLENIRGLRNLKYVQDFYLVNDTSLHSLQGLENLQHVSNSLGIINLSKIINLQGLDSMKYCRQFSIGFCENLYNLSGIDNVENISSIQIFSNNNLYNLDGLSQKFTYLDNFYIIKNPKLKQLTNLENLNFIWILSIEENQILDNLNGLDSVTEFAYLQISQNPSLESISALQKVNRIRVQTSLIDNAKLTNIDALSKTDMMSMDSLVIVANPLLDVCAIESICNYLADTSNAARISGNGAHCINRDIVEMECLLLPLELLDFNVKKSDKSALLEWTTANEKNHKSTIVERRTESLQWNKLLGTIQSQKQNNAIKKYSFEDLNPETGINYYRLKFIDQNGSYSYSPIKQINLIDTKSKLEISHINNWITIQSNSNSLSKITLYDQFGRAVITMNANQKLNQININELQSGIYILNILLPNGEFENVKIFRE